MENKTRNVFISFLGTNNYLQTRYQWNNEEPSKPVRFIQEAIISRIAKDWTEEDRIFIFYTDGDNGSYKLNWLDNGQTRFNEKDEKDQEIEKIGLQHRLNDLHLKAQIEGDIIPEGFSEDEVWEMFDKVYNKLKPSDKIYFDITHAFRSIPLFASSLFNFAQYVLKTEIISVNYGAFEKLGPAYKVKEIPIKDRIAPIIDMTNIVKLQKLTETATSITEFGRTQKNIIKNIQKLTGVKDGNAIKTIISGISDLDNNIQTNRLFAIKEGKYIEIINRTQKQLNKSETIRKPVREIINEINSKLKDFGFENDNSNSNILAAIKWATKYDMLPQAYTLTREYVLIRVADYFSDLNPFTGEEADKDFHEYISSILSMKEKDVLNNNFKGLLKEYMKLTQALLEKDIIKELRNKNAYMKLAQNRNIINHAKGESDYNSIKEAFNSSHKICLSILNKYGL